MASCVGLLGASVLDVLEVDVDLDRDFVTEAQDVVNVLDVADGDRPDVCLQDGAQRVAELGQLLGHDGVQDYFLKVRL